MNKIIYNIKYKAISLLLVLLSCSCTGIHPASSSSTGTPVTEVDTSTFFVRKAIDGEVLFKFTPGTSYADIHDEVARKSGFHPLFIQLISGSEAVKDAETNQEKPKGNLSYTVLTSRAIDQNKRQKLMGDIGLSLQRNFNPGRTNLEGVRTMAVNMQLYGIKSTGVADDLEHKIKQLKLLKVFLEISNAQHNGESSQSLLEMFEQSEPFFLRDLYTDIPVQANTSHASPVSVGNQNLFYNGGDMGYGNPTLGVIFHCETENVAISIATTNNKTLIEYYGLGETYAIAYLKEVDGALIMNVFPNNPEVHLAFRE